MGKVKSKNGVSKKVKLFSLAVYIDEEVLKLIEGTYNPFKNADPSIWELFTGAMRWTVIAWMLIIFGVILIVIYFIEKERRLKENEKEL